MKLHGLFQCVTNFRTEAALFEKAVYVVNNFCSGSKRLPYFVYDYREMPKRT